jgi:hypothetical protein
MSYLLCLIPAFFFLSALWMSWRNFDCGICIFFSFILIAAGLLSFMFILYFSVL